MIALAVYLNGKKLTVAGAWSYTVIFFKDKKCLASPNPQRTKTRRDTRVVVFPARSVAAPNRMQSDHVRRLECHSGQLI